MAAFSGKDITLSVDSVEIDDIETFVIPSITRNMIDIDPLGSDWTGSLTGNLTIGECTGTVFYDPANVKHQGLTDLLISGEAVAILVTHKSGYTFGFTGVVSSFGGGTAGNKEASKANFTLKGTGTGTFTKPGP